MVAWEGVEDQSQTEPQFPNKNQKIKKNQNGHAKTPGAPPPRYVIVPPLGLY